MTYADQEPMNPGTEHRPAGVVTRFAAMGVDMAVVIGLGSLIYGALVAVRLVWSPTTFRWPDIPFWLIAGAEVAIAVLYLSASWATTGRSYGDLLMGLRVQSRFGEKPRWALSFVRAGFCVVFPFGLLWVIFSPERRSLQDAVLRTLVVYDWGNVEQPLPRA